MFHCQVWGSWQGHYCNDSRIECWKINDKLICSTCKRPKIDQKTSYMRHRYVLWMQAHHGVISNNNILMIFLLYNHRDGHYYNVYYNLWFDHICQLKKMTLPSEWCTIVNRIIPIIYYREDLGMRCHLWLVSEEEELKSPCQEHFLLMLNFIQRIQDIVPSLHHTSKYIHVYN